MMVLCLFLVILGLSIGFVIGFICDGNILNAYFNYKIEIERIKDQQEQRMEEYVKRQREDKES